MILKECLLSEIDNIVIPPMIPDPILEEDRELEYSKKLATSCLNQFETVFNLTNKILEFDTESFWKGLIGEMENKTEVREFILSSINYIQIRL